MENLRLALAGIGILILAGVFVWGMAKSRRRGRGLNDADDADYMMELSLSARPENPVDVDGDLAELSGLVAESRGNTDVDPYNDSGDDLLPEAEASMAGDLERDDAAEAREESDLELDVGTDSCIIALYIVALHGRQFTGDEIVMAAKQIGARFNDMKILDYSGEDQDLPRPIFSIASMLEPGVFAPDDMGAFRTSGLVVFARMPGPLDSRIALEIMLDHARRLAEMLGGELRDELHEPLTEDGKKQLRERVSSLGRSNTHA